LRDLIKNAYHIELFIDVDKLNICNKIAVIQELIAIPLKRRSIIIYMLRIEEK